MVGMNDEAPLVRRMVIDFAQTHLDNRDKWLSEFPNDVQLVLITGLEQIARGAGLTADAPLEELGVAGTHALIRALGFEVYRQHASRSHDGMWFLDSLYCEDEWVSELVIYSRVPSGHMEMLLENTPEGMGP